MTSMLQPVVWLERSFSVHLARGQVGTMHLRVSAGSTPVS